MAAIPEIVVTGRVNWKYEKRIVKCKKCKSDILIEGDNAACFSGDNICTTCNNK